MGPVTLDAYETAIRAFWSGRELQSQRQIDLGIVDAGTRGSVTGGKHLDALTEVVADIFRGGELPEAVVQHGGKIGLPGYYRRAKNWDLVVTYKGILVAAIEFKSQVGSFGNNFNNRTEEALGNATDIWRANHDGAFGPHRPWLGFIMVVEEVDGSMRQHLRDSPPIYPSEPVFDGTSYIDRYRIFFSRLLEDGLYDAMALVSTRPGEGISPEPRTELSLRSFENAARLRIADIAALDL